MDSKHMSPLPSSGSCCFRGIITFVIFYGVLLCSKTFSLPAVVHQRFDIGVPWYVLTNHAMTCLSDKINRKVDR